MLEYHVLIFNIQAHFSADTEYNAVKGKDYDIDTWYFKIKRLKCACCSELNMDGAQALKNIDVQTMDTEQTKQ